MRVCCKNIGSLGSGEFTFSKGLNAVVGRNGSGKSTLVSALYFAFTGETINGENIDSLITWGCSNAEVAVYGDCYSIIRTISKTGSAKVKFVRGAVTLTRKKEVDQAICDMFGFVDLSVLKLVYFAEQYRAIDFVEVTDSARVQLLSALFGFARLEKLRADIQQRIADLDVSAVSSEVLDQLSQALKQTEEHRDALLVRLSALRADILGPDALTALNTVISSPVIGTRDTLSSRLSEVESAIKSAELEQSSLPAIPGPEEARKYSDFKRHKQLTAEWIKVCEEVEILKSQVGLSPANISEFLMRASGMRSELVNKKDTYERQLGLLQSGKCPLTGGIPCPDLRAMTDEDAVNQEIGKLETQIAQVDADIAEMQKALNESTSLANRLSACQVDADRRSHELASIQLDLDFDPEAYERAVADTDGINSRSSELVLTIAKLRIESDRLKQELDSIKDLTEASEEDIQAAKDSIQRSSNAAAAIQEVESVLPSVERSVAEQLSSIQFAEEQNQRAEVNQKKKDTLLKVRQVLHRDNLPKLLVEDMLSEVNQQVDKYLRRFAFPYTVTWSATGAIMYTDGVEWHRASQLSGGQKYVLVIAIRCALADLLASSFPLFVLDEPTTGLDVDNRESLSGVLNSAVGQFSGAHLVVPTHDDMLLPEANIISL